MDLSFEDAAMERRALALNGLQTAARQTEDRALKFEDWAVDKALSLNAELLGAASDVATVGGVVCDEVCRALTGHVEWSHAARSVSSGFLREYTTMNAAPRAVAHGSCAWNDPWTVTRLAVGRTDEGLSSPAFSEDGEWLAFVQPLSTSSTLIRLCVLPYI